MQKPRPAYSPGDPGFAGHALSRPRATEPLNRASSLRVTIVVARRTVPHDDIAPLAGGTRSRVPPRHLQCGKRPHDFSEVRRAQVVERRYADAPTGALLTGLVASVGPASRLRRRYADAPTAAFFSLCPHRLIGKSHHFSLSTHPFQIERIARR